MHRRDLLRYLLATPLALTVDYEKLLWVPKPIITVPLHRLTTSEIVAIEMQRILPKLRTLFERDDTFYRVITEREVTPISTREMRIPLILKPGRY